MSDKRAVITGATIGLILLGISFASYLAAMVLGVIAIVVLFGPMLVREAKKHIAL